MFPMSQLMTSYWIRFAGMLKPLLIVPGAVNAAVMVTESGELENFTHPTVVAVPRPNESAATAEWVLHNKKPPMRVGNTRELASRKAGRMRRETIDAQTGIFILADPFWFKVGLMVVYLFLSQFPKTSPALKQLLLNYRAIDFILRNFTPQ
jgi:hypothetical protein